MAPFGSERGRNMHFTKMQGLGNDYLYVYGEVPDDIVSLSVKLSDRHFGAGSDGMIYIMPSETADFRMRIFNADGSEAKMCGNGIRCVGKYVYEKKLTEKTELQIETASGIREVFLEVKDGTAVSASVSMGKAQVSEPVRIPVNGETIELIPVSVGNPHAVIFTDEAEEIAVDKIGPVIEHHPLFPDGVNVEFVQVLGKNALRMRVWERGSGITLACGTGASASAAAAVRLGLCEYGKMVSVILDGGKLELLVQRDMEVMMKGPAEFVYEGEAYL